MSRWCSKCHLTEYRSCDERCPVFGKHFEDLADKVIKLIEEKEKANMQGIADERERIVMELEKQEKEVEYMNQYDDGFNSAIYKAIEIVKRGVM